MTETRRNRDSIASLLSFEASTLSLLSTQATEKRRGKGVRTRMRQSLSPASRVERERECVVARHERSKWGLLHQFSHTRLTIDLLIPSVLATLDSRAEKIDARASNSDSLLPSSNNPCCFPLAFTRVSHQSSPEATQKRRETLMQQRHRMSR